MENILTDENFDKEISSAGKPVLVDFFATWCEPCTMLAPILEKIASEFSDKIVLLKANLDNIPLTAQKFGIEKIPTVVLFKGGKPISGFTGLVPEQSIKDWLQKTLGEENIDNGEKEKKIASLKEEYKKYAESNGFRLNPDEKTVERVINGLLENEKKYGEKYCPCRRVSGDKAEDAKKICPCFWHKEEIEKDGHCFCRLYTK